MAVFTNTAHRGLRFALVTLLFPIIVLLTGVGVSPIAHAATIIPTIKNFKTDPTEPQVGKDVQISFDWELPITAQSGDTFKIQLPDLFSYSNLNSHIPDRENPGNNFMTVSKAGAAAIFTVTDYAQRRIKETGKAPHGDFSAWVKISSQAEGHKDYDIIIPDGGSENRVTVTVKPSDRTPNDAFQDKYREAKKAGPSQYSPATQGFYWEMTTPVGVSEVTLIDDLKDEKNTPGQTFVCDGEIEAKYYSAPAEWSTPPNANSDGTITPMSMDVPSDKKDINCQPSKLTARFTDIPEGSIVYLKVPAKVELNKNEKVKKFTNLLRLRPNGEPEIAVEGEGWYKAPDNRTPEEKFNDENEEPKKKGINSTTFDPSGTQVESIQWEVTTGLGNSSVTISDTLDESAFVDGKAMYFLCDTVRVFVRSFVDGKEQTVYLNQDDDQDRFSLDCTSTKIDATIRQLDRTEVGGIDVYTIANKGWYSNTATVRPNEGEDSDVSATAKVQYGSAGSGVIDPDEGEEPETPVTPDEGDNPDTPVTPDEGEEPETPVNPGDGNEPDQPKTSVTPKEKPAEKPGNNGSVGARLPLTGVSATTVGIAPALLVIGVALLTLRRKVD